MFDGHLTYGGVEIINTERLQAYADNGLVPMGTKVEACSNCEGLAEALGLMEIGAFVPYTTPAQDQPPWFDSDNPDSWDFAGILPLAITGLDGSTGTVEVTETLRGGGVAGRRRYGPRTISVTALLVGRTTESVQAGLTWLTTALHRNCATTDTCGPVAALEGFTACPGPVCATPNMDVPPIVEIQDWNDGEWYLRNATFEGHATHGDLCPFFEPFGTLDGGPFDPEDPGEPMDGGTFEETGEPGLDGGPFDIPPDPTLLGILGSTQRNPIVGPVTITWSLLADDVPAVGSLVILDALGEVAIWGPDFSVTAPEDVTWVLDGVDVENWRAAIVTTDPDCIGVDQVAIQFQPALSIADCLTPYQRQFPLVATVAGPTVLDTLSHDDCADWLRVEWTWVAGSPYRYGVPEPLLIGGGFNTNVEEPPDFQAPGVSYDTTWDTPAAPWNCVAPPDPAVCFTDPCNPGFTAPPAAPFVTDPNRVTITTQDINNIRVCLDPSVVPANEGVLTVAIRNGLGDKVGLRVRVWDEVEPDCTPTAMCDFAYEYQIDYIPGDGIFTIDGVSGQFTTVCDGRVNDSSTIVRGEFGGPAAEPVVRCDRRYLIDIQYLNTYPRTCPGFYVSGADQGDLEVDVYVTPREG